MSSPYAAALNGNAQRERKTLQQLSSLSKGFHKLQFAKERLVDAEAMCRRDWGHFKETPRELPADGRLTRLIGDLAEPQHVNRGWGTYAGEGPSSAITTDGFDVFSHSKRL